MRRSVGLVTSQAFAFSEWLVLQMGILRLPGKIMAGRAKLLTIHDQKVIGSLPVGFMTIQTALGNRLVRAGKSQFIGNFRVALQTDVPATTGQKGRLPGAVSQMTIQAIRVHDGRMNSFG